MKKRSIALNLRSMNYSDLSAFTNRIYNGFVTEAATYPSPVVSLPDQFAANLALQAAVEKWGGKGKRGSHLDYVLLKDAAAVVRQNLKMLAGYCMIITPDDESSWAAVGFVAKQLREKASIAAMPRAVHQLIANNIPSGCIKIKWERPEDAIRKRTVTYKVMRSADEHYDNASPVAIVTKTSCIDNPPQRGVIYYYWVVPVNAYGEGVRSTGCQAFASLLG